MPRTRLTFAALVATLVLTTLVYWGGLSGPLVFDDLHNLAPIADWLQGRTGWSSVVFGNSSGLFGRPVSMASFVLNVELLGPGTFGLKLGNLAIHLVNGALVFALLRQLAVRSGRIAALVADISWLPWLGATVWLVHPLLVSTVLYVVQRMAMLSALFTLVTMLAYLHGRTALINGNRPRALVFLALMAPLATLLAVLSKENGILAPALCAALELTIFQPLPGQRRSWQSSGFIAATLVLPALAGLALTISGADIITAGYENRSFTLAQRLLTQPRVLWDYIGGLAAPGGPRLGFYHDDYVVSHGLLIPPSTTFALLAWGGVIVMAWRLRRAVPGFAAGTAIFLVGHALESTAFPLLMYFEHRNYLPAVGAIWAVLSLAAFTVNSLRQRMHHGARILPVAAAGLVLVLAAATAARAHIWQQNSSLMAQALTNHPGSRWLRLDLIAQAMGKQPAAIGEARAHAGYLLASTESSTHRLGAAATLLVDCASGATAEPALVTTLFAGRPEPLEADLLRVIESLADGVAGSSCRGLTPIQMAQGLVALLDRSRLPRGDLGIWRLRFKAAQLFLGAGDLDQALEQARTAFEGGTSDPQVAVFIADLLVKRHQTRAADAMLDAAAAGIASDDRDGKRIIDGYRELIDREKVGTQ